jgi:hypothetical protein
MIFGKSYERHKWQPTFAWLPHILIDGRIAWLETIERRKMQGSIRFRWEYRNQNKFAALTSRPLTRGRKCCKAEWQ